MWPPRPAPGAPPPAAATCSLWARHPRAHRAARPPAVSAPAAPHPHFRTWGAGPPQRPRPLSPRPQPRRARTSGPREARGPPRAQAGWPKSTPLNAPGAAQGHSLVGAEGAPLPSLRPVPSPLEGRPLPLQLAQTLHGRESTRGSGSNFSILPPSLERPTSQPASRPGAGLEPLGRGRAILQPWFWARCHLAFLACYCEPQGNPFLVTFCSGWVWRHTPVQS